MAGCKMILGTVLLVLLVPAVSLADVMYFSPRIGDGSEENPFRAHRVGSWVDCQSLGDQFLCLGPEVPNELGVVEVPLNPRAPLSAKEKAGLGGSLRMAAKDTLESVVWDLVDRENIKITRDQDRKQHIRVHGRDVAARDAPLVSYLDDILHVAAEIWHLPNHVISYAMSASVAYAAAELVETFTCADDSDGTYTCDNGWNRTAGTVAAIVSNTLRTVNSTSTQVVKYNLALDSVDMRHKITVVTVSRASATNRAGGPAIRYQDGNDYNYCVLRNAATDELEMAVINANVVTVLSTSTVTIAGNDTVEVRATGNDMSCYYNNALTHGPTTDTSHNTMTEVAVRFTGSGSDAASVVILDDSTASTYGLSGGATRRRTL